MEKREKILTRILNCKGQYVSLVTRTEVKPAAAYKDVVLEKIISSKYRAGIQFKTPKPQNPKTPSLSVRCANCLICVIHFS